MYEVFLNTLVATSWNAFAGDIAVKSRDAIKLHQEKYNANSVIPLGANRSDTSIEWEECNLDFCGETKANLAV